MKNRWLILSSALVTQTILGGIYAWSTLTDLLSESYGISNAESGFIFGLSIAIFTLVMVFSGHLVSKKGPRLSAIIASVFYLFGYLIASVAHGSFPLLLLGVGVFAGVGIGFGYVVPLSVGIQWFPKHKGLVTGLCVGGFGGGAIILSSIIEAVKLSGMSLDRYFFNYALISGTLLFLCALFFSFPLSIEIKAAENKTKTAKTSTLLWVSIVGMFCGTFSGLLLVGNLAPFIRMQALSEMQAVFAVMLFSFGNLSGRIIWGHLFDRMGSRIIIHSLLLSALFYGLLLFISNELILLVCILFLGFLFGSQFVLYAGSLSRNLCVKEFSRLYPLVFLSYGFAGIIAPGIGGLIADAFGSYSAALYLCIILVLIGSVVVWVAQRLEVQQ